MNHMLNKLQAISKFSPAFLPNFLCPCRTLLARDAYIIIITWLYETFNFENDMRPVVAVVVGDSFCHDTGRLWLWQVKNGTHSLTAWPSLLLVGTGGFDHTMNHFSLIQGLMGQRQRTNFASFGIQQSAELLMPQKVINWVNQELIRKWPDQSTSVLEKEEKLLGWQWKTRKIATSLWRECVSAWLQLWESVCQSRTTNLHSNQNAQPS